MLVDRRKLGVFKNETSSGQVFTTSSPFYMQNMKIKQGGDRALLVLEPRALKFTRVLVKTQVTLGIVIPIFSAIREETDPGGACEFEDSLGPVYKSR